MSKSAKADTMKITNEILPVTPFSFNVPIKMNNPVKINTWINVGKNMEKVMLNSLSK
ncbi:hypothetical protein [Flavobacterium sp. N2270]|uniref:hypothetical protein n=1 Tax=Flavobacterium sp. N2270 TaxID=2986831 RepID=UPI002225AF95|nr:hypothetical protein [Flavobacterium sp. N2270]